MNRDLATYLRLSPEFGGTRFGPFEGFEIRLGSDRSRCDITLPDSLGVLAIHVKVIRQQDGSMILAPAERTATVFLWKQGARKPVQAQTATAIQPGDSFALVTVDGPRFIIEMDELPPDVKKARQKAKSPMRRRFSLSAFTGEGKRQAWTQLLVTGPGQLAQRAVTMVRSGQIFQPRYIFLAITMGVGMLWGGSMSCKAKRLGILAANTQVKYDDCSKDLKTAENVDKELDSIPGLILRITSSSSLSRALSEDEVIRTAVKEQSKSILTQSRGYDWLIKGKAGGRDKRIEQFISWREAIAGDEKLDRDLALLAPYIGVEVEKNFTDWSKGEDSLAKDVCLRGPRRMSYRQALHLGMLVFPDALFTGDVDAIKDDKTRQAQALLTTIRAAGGVELPVTDITSTVEPFPGGPNGCVFIEGEDERTIDSKTLAAIDKQLVEGAPGLPAASSPHFATAALARYYAADIPDFDYVQSEKSGPQFAEFPTGSVLKNLESKGQWVQRRIAEVIARSVILPCEAVLRGGDPKNAEKVFGELPDAVPCLVIEYRLRNDE